MSDNIGQVLNGRQQFVDGNGQPLAGGRVFHYQPGTLTPVSTYSDPGHLVLNTQPVRLDAAGMADIFVNQASVRQVVKNLNGVTIWDRETSVASFNTDLPTDLSPYLVTATGTVTPRTLGARAADELNLFDFGAVGDNTTDDTTALNAFFTAVISTGKRGHMPAGTFKVVGTRLDWNLGAVGGVSRKGGVIYGDGAQRTIINVENCSGSPQFRIRDSSGAAFFWEFESFGIQCSTSGVGFQVGSDWNGSAYPDFLNSCALDKLVVTNSHVAAGAATRLNGVLNSWIDIVSNAGGVGIGDAIQLYGTQFCTGLLAAGNAANGIHISGYTYGNEFTVDVEVVNHCVLSDNTLGSGGPTRNLLQGVFVWGSTNANPAISGNDGTTDCVVIDFSGGPLIFGGPSQFGSLATPQVTGAYASLAVFEHRNIGTTDVGGLRIAQPPSGPAVIQLDSILAQTDQIQWRRAGLLRWNVVRDTTAESGGDAGSLLLIQAYADDGTTNLGNMIAIERNNRLVILNKLKVLGTSEFVGNVSFFGSGFAGRQTVTGSRGGNAALASLLTGLANLGLITDSTTV